VEFKHPVKLGQIVTLKARVTWVGRTSMEVLVEVFSEDYMTGEQKFTNRAYLTFVAVDENCRPTEVCGLLPETDEDKREYEAAEKRRNERLKRRQEVC
jgi:acyl-CoA hydrolase